MKFTVSTKPLADALALGVINANVSNFHMKSTLAQLTATKNTLRINLEASNLCTQIQLKGVGDADVTSTVFVSCVLLKQLVSTFDTSTVTLEFLETGLVLHSGSSKFTLPMMVDELDLELKAPAIPEYTAATIDLKKDNWKYVKENQMYAIAMSFVHPVYAYVWLGQAGEVIVGDFDNSLFTLTKKNTLPDTCLISDTIVNLFNSLPEGAKAIKIDGSYLIKVTTDSYEYVAEFSPRYESEAEIGSYNSDIILEMLKPSDSYIQLSAASIDKLLGQASMLSTGTEDSLDVAITGDVFTLKGDKIDGKLKAKASGDPIDCKLEFKTSLLDKVVSSYATEDVCIGPLVQEGEVVGLVFWNSDMTTVLAGND